MLMLAANHLIVDQQAFAAAMDAACVLARKGKLVTFGIRPDAPETGYGYIVADGDKVLRFIDKPSFDKARQYLESGSFLWNSGMFCCSAADMLRAMEAHCPDIPAATKACLQQ